MAAKYTKWQQHRPNSRTIDQTAVQYICRLNGRTIDPHLPLQDPPKFTQIGILQSGNPVGALQISQGFFSELKFLLFVDLK
jgi:hypothetical protein